MSKRIPAIREGQPLFDIVARGGRPQDLPRLSRAEIQQISSTVRRTPEVVVRVLTKKSNDAAAVARHIDYIGRYGALDLETDDGEHLSGRVGKSLLEDWDRDIDELRRQSTLAATRGREPPKIVHKLFWSMPPGTDPDKVLSAVRHVAREEFGLQHRYAFVLHTDEPHPHVHMVVKAISEQGIRLNIKKADLQRWRSKFAHQLRARGVDANATGRAVRGQSKSSLKDGIYRASFPGESRRCHHDAAGAAWSRWKLRPSLDGLLP